MITLVLEPGGLIRKRDWIRPFDPLARPAVMPGARAAKIGSKGKSYHYRQLQETKVSVPSARQF